MNVVVAGLWHLGTVTAACLAAGGHHVTGADVNEETVESLSRGVPPLFEPGLQDLVRAGLASGRLRFTTDPNGALKDTDVLWIAYDTPVDDEDRADVDLVVERAAALLPHLAHGALVLISSQVPVGTTRQLEQRLAASDVRHAVTFGYSPENLRLGKAIGVFTRPDRVVVGLRSDADRSKVQKLLAPFTDRIEWMSVESAEMTKHALNAFLATSVTFINEVAALCEQVGADAREVERGLKSESRIGPGAYLSPGGAFAGGTLARDVVFLSELGRRRGVPTNLITAVKASNDAHRTWAARRVAELMDPSGKAVAVWGLTYKPGTDTLRRSSALELCRWLREHGAIVRAHDPAVQRLPPDLADEVQLLDSPLAAVDGASALIIATPWPIYREIAGPELPKRMRRPLVLDAGRFLGQTLGRTVGIEYISVGSAGA